MSRQVKDYNTVTSTCAESCQLMRTSGIAPQTVIRLVCTAADIRYGGCRSDTGPDLLPEGKESCHLPIESRQAVKIFNAAAELLLNQSTPEPASQTDVVSTN